MQACGLSRDSPGGVSDAAISLSASPDPPPACDCFEAQASRKADRLLSPGYLVPVRRTRREVASLGAHPTPALPVAAPGTSVTTNLGWHHQAPRPRTCFPSAAWFLVAPVR